MTSSEEGAQPMLMHPDRKIPFEKLDPQEDYADNTHFREIADALKIDKRFHVLSCFSDERRVLLFEYIDALHVSFVRSMAGGFFLSCFSA